ncbi:hypothetical protein [Pedobacter gandavensis]|uniref:hypothetical protein n=1 Tax=Pedobacter gandavensis TaxID=2679963 RepID=UPI0029309D4A|nr:hypothetical protein [Pedobacter gandavensis]
MNRKTTSFPRTRLQPLYLVVLCLVLLSNGCQKNKQTPANPAKDKENVKDPEKPVPTPKVMMVPSRISSAELNIEFKYEGETTRLTEIIQSDGNQTKFLYHPDGTPAKYEQYKNNNIQQIIDYKTNIEGQIHKIFLFDHKYNTQGSRTIGYDEKKRINQLKKYDIYNKFSEEESISYDDLGNVISTTVTNNNKTTTMSAVYDTKAGIYQHIPHVQLLFLTHLPLQHPRIFFPKTNPLRIDYLPLNTSGSTYTYEYNSNNYPSSLVVKQGSSIKTMKITYKTIKPID